MDIKNNSNNNSIQEAVNIICFGDSITYGYQLKQGWPDCLKDLLNKKDVANRVYNLGIPSETTKDLLNRFENELKPRLSNKRKNIVIFAFGANDSAIIKEDNSYLVPIQDYVLNLKQMINTVLTLNPDSIVYLLGITKVNDIILASDPNDNQIRSNQQVIEYNNALDGIAKFYYSLNESGKVVFIDTSELPDSYIGNDGLHLTQNGEFFLGEQILKALKC
jgi:lysophospholipase L1-like esterase